MTARAIRCVLTISSLLLMAVAGCAPKAAAPAAAPAAFWPPPIEPNQPRIQYLTSISQSSDIAPSRNKLDELIYGKEDHDSLPLSKPYGVKMWQGKIYVCDLQNHAVVVLDMRKGLTSLMGVTGNDKLQSPNDIAISPDGYKYVGDSGKHAIYVFDPADKQVQAFARTGIRPAGLAVYNNELYVCDLAAQRVEVIDRLTGQTIRTIGGPGKEDGQFIWPLGVALDNQGNVFVMDFLKCRLQKFDHEGKLLSATGGISAQSGNFVRPKHIAIDRDGELYAVDAAFQNVQMFNADGKVLTFFGGSGRHPGAMDMPVGVCVSDTDLDLFQKYVHPAFELQRLIVVTNQNGNNKVAIYGLGHLKPGKTLADLGASRNLVAPGVTTQPTTGPSIMQPGMTEGTP